VIVTAPIGAVVNVTFLTADGATLDIFDTPSDPEEGCVEEPEGFFDCVTKFPLLEAREPGTWTASVHKTSDPAAESGRRLGERIRRRITGRSRAITNVPLANPSRSALRRVGFQLVGWCTNRLTCMNLDLDFRPVFRRDENPDRNIFIPSQSPASLVGSVNAALKHLFCLKTRLLKYGD